MADTFKIYKGDTVINEGESPLTITGVGSGVSVAKGEYQATRVEDDKESDRVDIPAFETLTTTTTTTEPTTTTTTTSTTTTTKPTTTTTTTEEPTTTTTTTESEDDGDDEDGGDD